MNQSVDAPQRAGILLNNLVPVLGVFLFSWPAVSVVFMYWLDGWLCFVELGMLAVTFVSRMPGWPAAGYTRLRRLCLNVFITALFIFLASIPSIVAGGVILGILHDHLFSILGSILVDRPLLVGIGATVVLRGFSIARRMAGHGVQDEKLSINHKAQLFLHRTVVMIILAEFLGGLSEAWTLKIFVLVIAVLFTFSEMQPDRYLLNAGIVQNKSEAEPTPKKED